MAIKSHPRRVVWDDEITKWPDSYPEFRDLFGVRELKNIEDTAISRKKRSFQVEYFTIKKLMDRFTYKPNWTFSVVTGVLGGFDFGRYGSRVAIKVEFLAENSVVPFEAWKTVTRDSDDDFFITAIDRPTYSISSTKYQPERPVIPVGGTFDIPYDMASEEQFWDWLRIKIITMAEEHERDEWFKVDGKPPFDPHKAEKEARERYRRNQQEERIRRQEEARSEAKKKPVIVNYDYAETYGGVDASVVKALTDPSKNSTAYKAFAKTWLKDLDA